MQEYDVALKLLLKGSAKLALQQLTGTTVTRWLNVELPEIRNTRADLLGETEDGRLIHLELQSDHDAAMAVRMAEYCLSVYGQFSRFPHQVLLYVGKAPLRMGLALKGPDLEFRYHAVDMRELDGEQLLESPEVGDNILAILARLRDNKDAVRRIVAKIAGLPPDQRGDALSQLLIVAGLRKLARQVEREVRTMPILNSILDHEVLGREFKKGLKEGRAEGREEGRTEGRAEGLTAGRREGRSEGRKRGLIKGRKEGRTEGRTEGQIEAARSILSRLIETRFGPMPKWAQDDVAGRSLSELEKLSVRVLDASSFETLLK